MYSTQLTEWNESLKKSRRRVKTIGIIIPIPFLVVYGLVLLGVINNDIMYTVAPILLVVALFVMTLLLIISSTTGSKKLITTEILPELIKEHKIEDPSFRYYGKSKTRDININGGLFTRFAYVQNAYKISTNKYSVQYTTISHSSGQTHTVDFQGLYFVFPFKYDKRVQIRTMGSANYARPNLKALKKEKGERYYSDLETDLIDSNLVSIFNSIKRTEQPKHLYMSLNKKELHIAISKKEYAIPKFNKITNTEIETLKQWLNKQIQFTDEILNDINYYN